MPNQLSDVPGRPFRPPPQPQPRQIQQPMVYVYEKQVWEYKAINRNATVESLLSEEELNTLGVNGWELVGVVAAGDKVLYYFKRVRA